jgi:dephospho-CoA kinase
MKHLISVGREVPVIKIALTGKLRSGKDTVAHHLYIRHGFDKVAFGSALKHVAHQTFPWVSEYSKPRALYQSVGQLMREIDPDVWVKHVERKVQGVINFRAHVGDANVGVVITDLRQPNEYEWARANGFSLIRVTCPFDTRLQRARQAGDDFVESDLLHSTEQYVDTFEPDYEIHNDGTIDDLKAQVDAILTNIQTGIPTYVNNNGATVFLPSMNENNTDGKSMSQFGLSSWINDEKELKK